jgi:hypothetical protein
MAERRIFIHLAQVANGDIHAIPDIPALLQVGDFVTYFSSDGIATVVFDTNGSPFGGASDLLVSGERRQIVQDGLFFCKCFIKPDGQPAIGWSEKKPESGGDHDVKP